jgi:hypothetical protein
MIDVKVRKLELNLKRIVFFLGGGGRGVSIGKQPLMKLCTSMSNSIEHNQANWSFARRPLPLSVFCSSCADAAKGFLLSLLYFALFFLEACYAATKVQQPCVGYILFFVFFGFWKTSVNLLFSF